MLTLPEHFAELLSNIEPQQDRANKAKAVPAKIRDYLKECDEIVTAAPHSRLAGSYARATAIHAIKDVDIVLLVSPDYQDGKPETVLDHLDNGLQGLPAALGEDGEATSLRHQRRSIRVRLEQDDFDVDVVPVTAPNGLDQPLWVPDRGWNKWVKTDPLGYAASLSKLNDDHGDKVVRLVKLLKHWRDAQMIYRRPKSYWLECMVYRHISRGWVQTEGQSFAELFTALLGSILEQYQSKLDQDGAVPAIPDPRLGNNVAWNWERSEFESFMRRIKESQGWAQRALKCGDDEFEEAVSLWQNVFNGNGYEMFPTLIDETSAAVIKAARSGQGLFVTATGRVLAQKPSTTPAWAAPPHRFYGQK